MTEKENRTFSSKILLFGEYLLLCDSKALSIPYYGCSGHFEIISTEDTSGSNKRLNLFLNYLKTVNDKLNLDLDRFEADINKGLIFKSNIPHSYGLGSSGALSAAVYHKYSTNRIEKEHLKNDDIFKLKNLFGIMESYFHGKSSGLDPLISYLAEPVLVEGKNGIKRVSLPEFSDNEGSVFLIDYGKSGDTGPLVKGFIDKCSGNKFSNRIKDNAIPINNKCIDLFLSGRLKDTISCAKEVSEYTLKFFKEMIPADLLDLWVSGIKNDTYYLKLCGSGGGGMVLGFTKNFTLAKTLLAKYNPEKIF